MNSGTRRRTTKERKQEAKVETLRRGGVANSDRLKLGVFAGSRLDLHQIRFWRHSKVILLLKKLDT